MTTVMMIKWMRMMTVTVMTLMKNKCKRKERRKRKPTTKPILRQEKKKLKEKNKDHFSKGCESLNFMTNVS